MAAEPCILRHVWVNITASSYDGLPEEVDHVLTRGAHPEVKVDPHNLRGLSASVHRWRHLGVAPPQRVDLSDIW
jgi:hypothetical protein